jgi:hypothetical protein
MTVDKEQKIMKRIVFLIIIFIIFFLSTFLYFKYISGWLVYNVNSDTPKEYLSLKKNDKLHYKNDSIIITQKLKKFLKNHEQSFYAKTYNEGTDLIIDSILYSPDGSKIVVLVITKSLTSRELVSDDTHPYYYDGYCYFGFRKNDIFDLQWYENSYTSFNDFVELSETLRDYYFRKFASKNKIASAPSYNLNDVRFWNSSIWNVMHQKITNRIEFDLEKNNHPENIFLPKK